MVCSFAEIRKLFVIVNEGLLSPHIRLYRIYLGFQLKAESLTVNNVMLSNLTLTPLTFKLVTNKPFILVELDPSSNKEGNTRAQSTEMHTLKPRHNLVVSMIF